MSGDSLQMIETDQTKYVSAILKIQDHIITSSNDGTLQIFQLELHDN